MCNDDSDRHEVAGAPGEDLNGRGMILLTGDCTTLAAFKRRAKNWCSRHPSLATGVAEMALGVTLIAWGAKSGAIEMGVQLLGTATDLFNPGEISGSAIGAGAGVVVAKIVGSIGVAAMGTAVAVPAALLAGGGAVLLGALGYAVGDVAYGLLNEFDPAVLVMGASALSVGLALLLDGAHRVAHDELVKGRASYLKDGAIHLYRTSATVIASTHEELMRLSGGETLAVLGPAAIATMGGAAVGSSIAAGSVTVLGSKALGSVALSLGLVSAPVWPVVTAAAVVGSATLAGGYLAVRWFRRGRDNCRQVAEELQVTHLSK